MAGDAGELSNNFHSETAWSLLKGAAKNLAGRPARDRLQSGACGRHGRPRPCERKGPGAKNRVPDNL